MSKWHERLWSRWWHHCLSRRTVQRICEWATTPWTNKGLRYFIKRLINFTHICIWGSRKDKSHRRWNRDKTWETSCHACNEKTKILSEKTKILSCLQNTRMKMQLQCFMQEDDFPGTWICLEYTGITLDGREVVECESCYEWYHTAYLGTQNYKASSSS